MTAPRETLWEIQRRWDEEGRTAARRPLGAPSHLQAWAELWGSVPARDKRDLLVLALWTPALLLIFTACWWGLPA